MHLGRVIGTVVSTIKNHNLSGQRLLIVQPYTYEQTKEGKAFVAVDTVSAGRGEWIFYVKSREAANALADPFSPSDRTILGIVDSIQLQRLRGKPKRDPSGKST